MRYAMTGHDDWKNQENKFSGDDTADDNDTSG